MRKIAFSVLDRSTKESVSSDDSRYDVYVRLNGDVYENHHDSIGDHLCKSENLVLILDTWVEGKPYITQNDPI